MKILVVDDDPEIVNFLRKGLIFEGYKVKIIAVTIADFMPLMS